MGDDFRILQILGNYGILGFPRLAAFISTQRISGPQTAILAWAVNRAQFYNNAANRIRNRRRWALCAIKPNL
jgi:hypothetical protein